MKKICIIGQFPPPMHGLAKALDTLCSSDEIKKYDVEKIDITNNKKILKNLNLIKKSDADIFYFTISQSKFGNIRDLIMLKQIIKKHKKCIIHLHGGNYRNLIEKNISKYQKKLNYNLVSRLDGAIVLGKSLKFNFDGMIDKDKIYIVHNCADEEFICSETEFNKKIKNLENKKIKNVLYLSNFIRSKGYDKVLELAKLEKENFEKTGNRKFSFEFAGKFFDDEEKVYFEKYISENQLEDYIKYHGIVGGDEKKDLLYNSDVFVLLTNYPNEGQPISIIEAMFNGMVIVTTDHAGIPDLTRDTNNIIASGKYDIKKIYKKLCDITKTDYENIFIENRKKATNEFSRENYINSIINIFDEVEK